MTAASGVRIVICSAGRRVYLVRWFREALRTLGVPGTVIATDADLWSPAAHAADRALVMPPIASPDYPEAMLRMVETLRPHLLLSVNDYELEVLAGGLADEIRRHGTLVPGLAEQAASAVVDKVRMAELLTAAGVPTPPTVLAADAGGVRALRRHWDRLVVKHRHGSGSSGLHVVPAAQVERAIAFSAQALGTVTAAGSSPELERIIVQPALDGEEYGIDLVGDLRGSGECGVLARRKLRMRDGETYRAVSVAPEEFASTARGLADVLRPTGPVDVDIIHTPDGQHSVIDVNPRFGGGYAFSHMAGADMPLHYVQSLTGRTVREDCLSYAPGLVASKFVDVALTVVGPSPAVPETAAQQPERA